MDNREGIVEFIAGDVLASVFIWVHFDITTLLTKLAMTLLLGFAGGLVGMMAKDFYGLIKQKVKRLIRSVD